MPRAPAGAREDLEDLASAKALDLLTRAEQGAWDPTGRAPGEVVAYIRSTARHGLSRWGEQNRRMPAMSRLDNAGPVGEGATPQWAAPPPSPEQRAETTEFVAALVDCLSGVQARARRIWVLRAVLDLSTREIAAHPDAGANKANVDVILMRVRTVLRECLGSKGFEMRQLPPGTFTQLWDAMSHAFSGLAGATREGS